MVLQYFTQLVNIKLIKSLLISQVNVSLGLGVNRLTIELRSNDTRWSAVSYRLRIYRQSRPENPKPFDPHDPNLRPFTIQRMELQPSDIAGMTWSEATARWNNLSLCPAGEGSTSAQDGGNVIYARLLILISYKDFSFVNIGTLTSSLAIIYDYD